MTGAIASVFREQADAYVRDHSDALTVQQRRAIGAIRTCGTPAAGALLLRCDECGTQHLLERSCGNRICPSCQTGRTAKWLAARLSQQLPTHYFLLTFTLLEFILPCLVVKTVLNI